MYAYNSTFSHDIQYIHSKKNFYFLVQHVLFPAENVSFYYYVMPYLKRVTNEYFRSAIVKLTKRKSAELFNIQPRPCGSEEEKQPGKQLAKALESLASEDAMKTVLASQLEIYFSKCYLVGLLVDTG